MARRVERWAVCRECPRVIYRLSDDTEKAAEELHRGLCPMHAYIDLVERTTFPLPGPSQGRTWRA